MPGGNYDSSLTRVAPVFDQLQNQRGEWVRHLLAIPRHGFAASKDWHDLDLTFVRGSWGPTERGLPPPDSLLSWLIQNLAQPADTSLVDPNRARLIARDAHTIELALELLKSTGRGKAWHVLEGPTYPDAIIETPDALIVIEGKRTEAGPTTKTKWMAGRHQMWRHLDAAWEARGTRQVFGFFLVEGDASAPLDVPPVWREAATATISASVLDASLPHRSQTQREQLLQTFLGAATWQAVCSEFRLDVASLPDTTPRQGR
jgi:hypothetical protein